MSKSLGNVIYADDLVNKFGVDPVRFYVLHEIPFSSDGNLSYELLIDRINSELANTLGNLVQRTISMGNKYFDGKVTNKGINDDLDNEFIHLIKDLDARVEEKMNTYHISDAITCIFDVLRASNKYIDYIVFGVDNMDQLQQYLLIRDGELPKKFIDEIKSEFNDVPEKLVNPVLWK